MKNYCNSYKVTVGALICLFVIFGMTLQGEAANVSNVSASPNPFDPDTENTTISYDLNTSAILWLRIYDSSGVLKRKLVFPANNYTENRTSGSNSDVWDGRDDMSDIVPDGAYPYYIDDIAYISASSTGQSPYDLVVDPSNSQNLWMTASDRLYKSTDGGSSWSQALLYSGPAYGIAISNDGQKIYVLDNGSERLYYSIDGGSNWSSDLLGWPDGKMMAYSEPYDIACNSDGTILYGVDRGTDKIYKSINSGDSWNIGTEVPVAVTLAGIAIDPSDSNTILVADVGATRVYQSTTGGSSFTTILSSSGTGDGEFNSGNGPYQISFDANGYYWVSDRGNHRIQQFDSNNNWVMTVGGPSSGTGDYQFNSNNVSLGIFATSFAGQQYLYAADYNNTAIKRYAYDNYASGTDITVTDMPVSDPTPPAAITDLATTGTVGSNSVELTWTAPGDDGNDPGTQASSYDVRYAKTPITTDVEFSAAGQATGEPTPSVQGTTEYFTVTGLESNTVYYFAIKSLDEINTSDLSTTSPIGKTGLLFDWNMVSCPLQPVPNDSGSVFRDDAGINWMWHWCSTWAGAGDPDVAGYWEKAATIVPGKGVFLFSCKSDDPTDASGTEITDASFTLSLSAGWNLIGNPYGTSVSLSSCDVIYTFTQTYGDAVISGWIGNAVYIWNGSTYDSIQWDSAKLEPWKGYWIFSDYDLDLKLYKP
ncbi:MAG: hypothetical protein JRE23_01795 [Deltaproteobacteria bacterium]|nr:hypothetical protein [Deltaproteobacteria bacterium]